MVFILPSVCLAAVLGLLDEPRDAVDPSLPGPLASLVSTYPVQIAIDNGGRAFDRVAESSLYRTLERSQPWIAAWKKKEAKQGITALRFLAGAVNSDLKGFLRTLVARRIVVCFEPRESKDDGAAPDILAFVDLGEPALAKRYFDVLDQAATLVGATDEGISEGPIRSANGSEFHATSGSYLLFANTKDKLAATLAALPAPQYADEPSRAPDGPPRVLLRLDLPRLRKADSKPAAEKHGNGIEALLVHGLNVALNRATTVHAELALEPAALRLTARLSHPPLESTLDHWYRDTDAPTPPDLWPQGAIASLRLDRRFAEFYRDHESWLAEDSANDFVQFDNGMNLFFGGRSFADEILPALGQGALLLVTPQSYQELERPPAVALPAFTLIANVVKGKLKETELATAFQSAITFINVDRAGKGKTSLVAGSSREGKVTIYDAHFAAPETPDGSDPSNSKDPGAAAAPDVRFNATPALALTEDHLVVGSAREGVAGAVRALAGTTPRKAKPAATELRLDLAALAAILDANREGLITDRMLKEGESRGKAAAMVELILTILGDGGRLDASLEAAQDGHRLEASLDLSAGDRR